ncbi:hypothetical protein E2562_036943 [Oryza meyeriana var. granulata]|uniref:Uncharacterized protein n=1 Tax=Oryza meyeriana var. granulata TaxID=110450 RepID=A0A6G1CBN3_9ORYZ|nr:hypothetical protein E2562_036943 [Oryza meyeriana var. granulata]
MGTDDEDGNDPKAASAGGTAGRRDGGAGLRDDQGRLLLRRSGTMERPLSGQGSGAPGGGSLLRGGATAGEHERRGTAGGATGRRRRQRAAGAEEARRRRGDAGADDATAERSQTAAATWR